MFGFHDTAESSDASASLSKSAFGKGATPVMAMVTPHQELLDIPSHATVGEAFKILDSHQVLSMPVYSKPDAFVGAGNSRLIIGDRQYIGIISVIDLVAHVFRLAAHTKTTGQATWPALETQVWRALGSTDESLTLWVEEADGDASSALAHFATGIHRVIVVPKDRAGRPLLLTQTDILKFIVAQRQNDAELDRFLGTTSLRDLGIQAEGGALGEKRLVTVAITDDLDIALGIMLQKTVSAVGVVDLMTGALLTTLSMSDLRGLDEVKVSKLRATSVGKYLRQRHGELLEPLTCTLDDTIGKIVDRILDCTVHRCWIVQDRDEVHYAHGVLTMTDILALIQAAVYPLYDPQIALGDLIGLE